MAETKLTRPCSHCKGSGRELDPHAVGWQMRSVREKAGKSLRHVADKLGYTAAYISDLERGNRPFTEEMIVRYKAALK